MKFLYESLDAKHRLVEGVVDAENREHAVRIINAKGLKIIELQRETFWHNLARKLNSNRVTLSDDETSSLLKELRSVLKSGLKPLEALEFISIHSEDNKKIREASLHIYQDMKNGASLYEAFNQAGMKVQYCSILDIGEKSGDLSTALDVAVDQIKLGIQIKKGFTAIYAGPAVTATFMLLATIASIVWLIPLQENIIYSLAETPEQVPPISAAAFWIGRNGIPIIIGFFLFIIGFLLFKKIGSYYIDSVETFFDTTALKMPVFGSFHRNAEYSKICSMLMISMSSGFNQKEVIQVIKDQLNTKFYRTKMNRAYKMVDEEGYLISQAFDKLKISGVIVANLKRGERADNQEAVSIMRGLSEEFSARAVHNLEVLKGASEMINMFVLSILSIPVLMISVAPAIDQITLMMNKF